MQGGLSEHSFFTQPNFRCLFRTNFFLVFGIASGLYLLGLFEFFVPLLELLPEENFIFICFIFVAVFCFYKVSLEFDLIFIIFIGIPLVRHTTGR